MCTSRLRRLLLLPIIAEYADGETTVILTLSDLLLKQILLNGDGFAASRETPQSRTDYDEKLGNAFNELFSAARANKEAVTLQTANNSIESRLSSSAPVW